MPGQDKSYEDQESEREFSLKHKRQPRKPIDNSDLRQNPYIFRSTEETIQGFRECL